MPFHWIVIEDVLQVFDSQSQEARGNDGADFLAPVSGPQEQQERETRKGQPMDFAMQAYHGPWPGGLKGTGDQEENPKLGKP
jgi:hypothetical protein